MSNDVLEHGVEVSRRGAVEVWTISRADRMNALGRATVRELYRLAREVRSKRDVRAVVITGEGERAFCAGADLKERRSMTEEDVRDFLPLYRAAFGEIDKLDRPVVAALNGVAFGGGLELALACDFRVMDRDTRIGLTEVSLAIIPGAGGTQRITRIVGEARAKELILFSKRLNALEARALGIVTQVTKEGESALDCAITMLAPLVKGAPIAIAAALEAIDGASELPLDAGLLHERRCYERTLASSDRLEALAAFKEKREPVYRGE